MLCVSPRGSPTIQQLLQLAFCSNYGKPSLRSADGPARAVCGQVGMGKEAATQYTETQRVNHGKPRNSY